MSESESLLHVLLPLLDVTVPGIFRLSGNNTRQNRLIDTIRSGLDTKSLELNSHDVATVIKQVLREYPGRLFDSTTESVLSRLVKDNSETSFQRIKDVVNQLSPDRISFLAIVLPFLYKVSSLSDVNKMDASNLARVIALDFFPDISNPMGTDSTLVRQIIDWRIKVVERLIMYGDKIIEEGRSLPVTPLSHVPSATSVTPVYGKSDSTSSCLPGDASQKRKRPPQSPLKSVWHGLTNIFSKTPRPGRPESTPPNGTPSFFSRVSNRLCPSGKKVKHEEDEMVSGYRSDDNSLRCPPVKQNLRAKFSHKKKSPKVTTPGRLKTPSTPLCTSNYGTFSRNPFPPQEMRTEVRTEFFDFSKNQSEKTTSAILKSKDELDQSVQQCGVPFIFSSSQQNLSGNTTANTTLSFHHDEPRTHLSPVNISPEFHREDDDESSNAPNPLVDNNFTGESNSCSNSNHENVEDMNMMEHDAMETATCETEVTTRPTTASSSHSLLIPVLIPDPSPSMSHLAEEMRDSLSDLLNIGGPRCRQPVMDAKMSNPGDILEPVYETTFDASKDEAEKRLIAQVRRQLGPGIQSQNNGSGSRRPSVANLERSAMVSQGRRLWEQGGPCTSSMSNYSSAFNLALQNAGILNPADPMMQSNSFPRTHVTSTKRQTDL